ncbi:MAG: hypothetical protein GY716_24630 [bacterium]|nr:hypothetical protein [bacterium]
MARTSDASVGSHLEGCAACARFAERLGGAQSWLREHHARVEPDASFAGRVVTRLPDASTDALGWAAMRLLPATLALLVALAFLALQSVPSSTTTTVATTEDAADELLTWILDDDGDDS